MVRQEPCFLTLSEAALMIRQRDLSPVELVQSCLTMIDRLEPQVQAWVTLDRDGALQAAAQLEAEARDGRFRGLLHGVPVGVKDIFYTARMRTTAGHSPMADFVPEYDSAVVERLRRSGAVVLGKTTTTEFALLAPTATRNPWNPAHTPGGSSSGSGAAVAARMCPAAIGSQTGGSTIRPAAYCGTVGFKPTHGRVSCYGMIPLAYSTDHAGVIVRSASDLAPILQALAGYDPRDHTSAQVPVDDYLAGAEVEIVAPRIALLMAGDFTDKSSAEVRANVEAVAAKFGSAGARVEAVAPPASLAQVADAFWKILVAEAAAYHRDALEQRPETFKQKTRELLDKGLAMPATKYLGACKVQREFRREVTQILRRFDAILVPSTPTTAPAGLESTGDPVFNNPWSLTGNPVVGLPSGLSATGLPFAVQLVGASFAEWRLLALARWCERILGFAAMPAMVKS